MPLAHDCTDVLMFERSDERPQAAVLRCQRVDLAAGLREIPCDERQDRAKRGEPVLEIGAIDGARLIVHLGVPFTASFGPRPSSPTRRSQPSVHSGEPDRGCSATSGLARGGLAVRDDRAARQAGLSATSDLRCVLRADAAASLRVPISVTSTDGVDGIAPMPTRGETTSVGETGHVTEEAGDGDGRRFRRTRDNSR